MSISNQLRHIVGKQCIFEDFSAVGTASTILPDTVFEEGVVLGAMSLTKDERLLCWSVYVGISCKFLKKRIIL